MATRVPKEPPEIRILNPYFIQEAAFTLIGLPFNNGLMGRGVRHLDLGRGRRGWGPEVPWQGRTEGRVGIEGSVLASGAQLRGALLRVSASLCPPPPSCQNIPTLGSVAVTMALHGCDEVAVAGFGYDMSTPDAPLHYYETVRMAAIREVRGWVRGSPGAGGVVAVPAQRTDSDCVCTNEWSRGEPVAGLAARRSLEGPAPPSAKLGHQVSLTTMFLTTTSCTPLSQSSSSASPLPTARSACSLPWSSPCLLLPAPRSSPAHLGASSGPSSLLQFFYLPENCLAPSNNPQTLPLSLRMPPVPPPPSPVARH